jgi:hypothetical protein
MIVRMTERQYVTVTKSLVAPLCGWFETEALVMKVGRSKMVEVDAILPAWRQAMSWLLQNRFSSQRGIDKADKSLFGAVKRMAAEINRIDSHPAFTGNEGSTAMLGWQTEVLPGWRNVRDNGTTYLRPERPPRSAFVFDEGWRGYELVAVWPEHRRHGSQAVTIWLPRSPETINIPEYQTETYDRFISSMS